MTHFYNPRPRNQSNTITNTFHPNNTNIPSRAPFNPKLYNRHLTNREMLEKRSKGLCLTCNEKCSASHLCKNKELNVFAVSDGEDSEPEETIEADLEGGVEQNTTVADISLCLIIRLKNPKTMKLIGSINGEEVIMMIDPGATNNFISLKTAQQLPFHIPPM